MKAFKECFIVLCLTAGNEPCSNNLENANGKLVNKHRHTFVEETKFECLQLIGADGVANYEGMTILAAYKSHASQCFNKQLKHMVDIVLDWISKEIRIPAGTMKRDLLSVTTNRAGKQIDTKHILDHVLRNGMERLMERIFGTHPEDYSFGDKGLQYDSAAKTLNHIGTLRFSDF
ncbi:hypothetical protein GGF37_003923 [Kickxella alabastrina]|nr:hypothetical protein GGF37_003923 [Kickxella alabastrina]